MSRVLIVASGNTCDETVATISSWLRNNNHQVLSIHDPHEVTKVLLLEPPDLLLVDTGKSGTEGLALVDFLRHRLRQFTLPVIVLGQPSNREMILKARALGVQEYLLKSPLSASVLMARLSKYLRATEPVKTSTQGPGGRINH